MFKTAIKAVTQRKDDDALEPAARKRRSGEKEGGGPLLVTGHLMRAGRPAARGRYAKLQTKAPKTAAKLRRGFMRAADDATADPVQEAALYLSDTLQLVQG